MLSSYYICQYFRNIVKPSIHLKRIARNVVFRQSQYHIISAKFMQSFAINLILAIAEDCIVIFLLLKDII